MPSRKLLAATLLATAAMTRIPVADVGSSTLDADPYDAPHGPQALHRHAHGGGLAQAAFTRNTGARPGQ